MGKTTYQNIVTVPNSGTDTVKDDVNIGGDIVTNFKAIADQIHPDGTGALAVGCANSNLEDTYASSESMPGAQGLHIINNNVLGYASGDGIESTQNIDTGSGSYSVTVHGVGSGAFMKGVLLRCPDNSKTLLNVPYAGAMVVHYDIIAFNGSNLSVETGTLKVFASGIEGDTSTSYGTFNVLNGDLEFYASQAYNAIQIGLHGTILAGSSYELNSWQSGNEYFSGSSY